jgi:hypothetical protein
VARAARGGQSVVGVPRTENRSRVLAMDYTILDDGKTITLSSDAVASPASGQLRVSASTLKDCLGWDLKPEGLCRESVCVPVPDRKSLVHDDRIELSVFAEVLGRPIVIDSEERIAALGTGADSQAAAMATLQAPDFELPDLAGRMHTLSEHRGKKVLLIAYASW